MLSTVREAGARSLATVHGTKKAKSGERFWMSPGRGQNLAAFCSEKINASGGEVYLNCCRRLRTLLAQPLRGDLRVGMEVEDWSMACDNTPAAPEDYNILISAVFDIDHGAWRFMMHRDNPFGFKASVNNFNRDP